MKYIFLTLLISTLSGMPGESKQLRVNPGKANFSDTVKRQDYADLTGPWQLFVDDHLVDRKENIKRTYHPFTKHPDNPLLVADKPWEGGISYAYGTVLPNEKGNGYRLWYHAWMGEYTNLYATSKDGFRWEKPELGIIDFKGSKANNIFFRRTKEDHLPQVIYTPWEQDPNRRYKLLNYDYGRTKPDHLVSGFWGAYSSDGIHWKDANRNPVLKDPGDVGNFVWDSHREQYIGYPKIFAPVRGFNRRSVGYTATKDFENWPSAQLILEPDENDDHWVSHEYQRTEFYGLSAFPYESAYLGFLWIFHITDGKNDGPIYCELVSSRDGINWVRQESVNGKRTAILPIGPPGTWDRGMVFTTNHPLVENNIIKLWYGGFTATHGVNDDNERGGIGLATLRKDGFASLDAKGAEGIVTTNSLKNLHGALLVNANSAGGSLKVEVLRENGKVLAGFSRNECEAIRGDGTELQVTWRDNKVLPDVSEALRLRFILQNAELYSFMGGENVELAAPEQPQRLHLSFEKNDKARQGISVKGKKSADQSALSSDYRTHGKVSIEEDPANAAKGRGAAQFQSGPSGRLELLNTIHLGPKFTLSISVKTNDNRVTRLFSNYRGSGELVTGELLFDCDPTGKEIPGLRFNVNGQTVLSKPVKFDDGKYHQFTVTYDLGKVILYLDGREVGQGELETGAAHLYSDRSVRRYFELPNALPEVGIHLGGNLCVGGDIGGSFVTYNDNVMAIPQAQLTGFADEILLERKVFTASEIQQIYQRGIQRDMKK